MQDSAILSPADAVMRRLCCRGQRLGGVIDLYTRVVKSIDLTEFNHTKFTITKAVNTILKNLPFFIRQGDSLAIGGLR